MDAVSDPPARPKAATWTLRVDGLVTTPIELTRDELIELVTADPSIEPSAVGERRWLGTPLANVVRRAKPLPTATALYVHAEGFRTLLGLDVLDTALLVTHADGAPLTRELGGPCRLIIPGEVGRRNVKWVGRIELFRRRRDK